MWLTICASIATGNFFATELQMINPGQFSGYGTAAELGLRLLRVRATLELLQRRSLSDGNAERVLAAVADQVKGATKALEAHRAASASTDRLLAAR